MVVGLLGAVVSFYLAGQHYSDAPALCDAGNLYSCSTVNTSKYSELFGIPIAVLGLGHFVALALLQTSTMTTKMSMLLQGRCFSSRLYSQCCTRLCWQSYRRPSSGLGVYFVFRSTD